MVTNREGGGGTVSCQIRHNNPYLLLIMILGLKTLYLADQFSKGALDNTIGCDVDPYFRIEWPRSLPLLETAERRALDQRFKDLWDRHKPPDSQKDNEEIVTQRFKQYMADPEVQQAYATFRDIEWKKKNYFPPKVAHVVDAFQKAGKYIFEVRGFRKRGEKIEVHCLTPWTANPEVYGYSKDGHFTYPYIHMNLDKVPVQGTDADREALDNLRVTAVHELFHVCQKEYYNWTKYANPGQIWGGGVNHWFMEATALVFEEEAKDYYLAQKWNTDFPLTADNLYASQKTSPGSSRKQLQAYFKVPMDSGGTETESGHRGYALSQFLLDLRRRYYSRNPEAFLRGLLEAFGSFRSGPIDALVKVTSDNEKIFRADYMVFCFERAENIFDQYPPASREESLNPAEPMIKWPLVGPLSSPCLTARIRGLGGVDLQKCKVLVRTGDFRDLGQIRRREPGGDFRTITGASLLLSRADMGAAASQAGVSLQRIETYVKEPEFPFLGETDILLLAPPRDIPKVQFDTERQVVRLQIPPSVLRNQEQVKDYRVTLYRLRNGKPLTFTTEGKSEVEIAWRQIAEAEPPSFSFLPIPPSTFTPLEVLDMMEVAQYVMSRQGGKGPSLRISYHEVVSALSALSDKLEAIEGPESEIFEIPVEGFQLPGVRYDVSGGWSGKVWVARIPLSAQLSQSGDKLTGTCSWGTDVFRVDGKWNAKEDAWEITPWVKEGNTETPALMTLYLRALPGEKLWLGAPPCVLRPDRAKSENKGGWFSWFKW